MVDTLTITTTRNTPFFGNFLCIRYSEMSITETDQCVFWLPPEGKALFSQRNIPSMICAPYQNPNFCGIAADWLDDKADYLLDNYTGTVDRTEAQHRLFALRDWLRSGFQKST